MSDELTPERIDQLAAMREKATRGKVIYNPDNRQLDAAAAHTVIAIASIDTDPFAGDDGPYLAELLNAAPALLAAARDAIRLRVELSKWSNQFRGGLGQAQQAQHMADAAAESLGRDYETLSPFEIREAIAKLTAERDAARKRLGEAEGLLEPFAAQADRIDPAMYDDDTRIDEISDCRKTITYGECRRAAAFLSGRPATTGEGGGA